MNEQADREIGQDSEDNLLRAGMDTNWIGNEYSGKEKTCHWN